MQTVAEHTGTVNFDAALTEAANRARAAYPKEQTRINKAVAIVQAHGIELLVSGVALVRSQSDPDVVYEVNGHCQCPDVPRAPEGRCKHVWSKSLLRWANAHMTKEDAPMEEKPTEEDSTPTHPTLRPEWIATIKDNTFVRYPGLLCLAHERGLQSLTAQIEHHSESLVLASATATFGDGKVFTEWADATPSNVGAQVRSSWIRIALTRAKARCLRDALAVEMCSVEELSE